MSIYCPSDPPELSSILQRLRKKKSDYEQYDFNSLQTRALMAFFDLAQEYETLANFYRVAVFVPKEFLGFDCCLYLVDYQTKQLQMACDSLNELSVCGMPPPAGITVQEESYISGDSFVAPIRGNLKLLAAQPLVHAEDVIGLLEVFPYSHFGEKDRLFFEKYANRIGYNLHYKLISIQNENHLKFINTLIADIDHNIIVPNMRFKVLLSNIKKKIALMYDLKQKIEYCSDMHNKTAEELVKSVEQIKYDLSAIIAGLSVAYDELDKHYTNTSLFLESLLRREHFEKGEFVLRRRLCNVKKEIIDTQLERYRSRLERRGIQIDEHLGGVPSEEIPLAVDVGLMSQVYANLFSNAEKYCEEVINEHGQPVKFVSYGRELLPNFFGPGMHGIKFNVFSTGPHLSPEEAAHVFAEGFRGKNVGNKPGAGHGLHFVKKIIDVHGGKVGCEPTFLGNNFYFILPVQTSPESENVSSAQEG
ncbi:MAG: HAMP domain-containing sensor histidine kinase [Deltaproteobacteria bacterium]|nr:HAMP domain-containing sensor histidine kinase [Deltaproteobacteria bacterium]